MMPSSHRKPAISMGGFQELIVLFLPLLFVTFSSCFVLFVEKLFFAHLSLKTMEAGVNAIYVCQIFQAPSVALAMMAQVCVGRWYGSRDWKKIGPGIWQFIWFSVFSIALIVPCSFAYGSFYFQKTDVEGLAWPYFTFLMWTNFLFPLGAALSCFYLGQGKTRFILWSTLGAQALRLLLCYILVLGWEGWIPVRGLIGGVWATVISQGGFCLLLLIAFLKPHHAANFGTREWRFQPSFFWECIQPGILRAANGFLNMICWASIAHLMVSKEGDYLLILSLGGTLFFFLPFLGDALCRAQTTVVSQLLGAKNYASLSHAFRSGMLLVSITVGIMGIPLLLFPGMTCDWLFPNTTLEASAIRKVFFGVWISFAFFTASFIPISYILAFKDTRFSLFMGVFGWINGYLFMYVAIEYMQMAADQFWIYLSVMHASNVLFYYWRMRRLESKALVLDVQLP